MVTAVDTTPSVVGTCALLPDWARRARRRRRTDERPDEQARLLWVVRVLRAWDADCTLLRLTRTLTTWELERAGFRIPPYVPDAPRGRY